MEKYGQWRDKKTGIHPFVAPHYNKRNFCFECFGYFVALFIRFPLLLLILILLFSLDFVVNLLVMIPVVRRVMLRFVHVIFCGLALFALGYHSFPSSSATHYLRRRLKEKGIVWPRAGGLIVANSSSFIDVLYLAFSCSPCFVAISSQAKKSVSIGVYFTDSSFYGRKPMFTSVSFTWR